MFELKNIIENSLASLGDSYSFPAWRCRHSATSDAAVLLFFDGKGKFLEFVRMFFGEWKVIYCPDSTTSKCTLVLQTYDAAEGYEQGFCRITYKSDCTKCRRKLTKTTTTKSANLSSS